MDVYIGLRHVTAHGASAVPRQAYHRLVAGCVFAEDSLRAFLKVPKAACQQGQSRDYVGDITLHALAVAAEECAARMSKALACAIQRSTDPRQHGTARHEATGARYVQTGA